ncbi:MAG: YihY/virulence factor BrkB family protein [Mycobacterium leprae]
MTEDTRTRPPSESQTPGSQAREPQQIPPRGWWQIAKRVRAQVKEDRLMLISAGVAFFSLLAIPPTLLAALSIYGIVTTPQELQQQLSQLTDVLPSDARGIVRGQLQTITAASSSALGWSALIGVLVALWSASGGMGNLIEALNVAYDEEEGRGFVKRRLLALAFVLGGILMVGAVAVLGGLVPALASTLPSVLPTVVTIAAWLVLALLTMLALTVLYRFGPNRDRPEWGWASWGAVIATVVWVVASLGFFFYVSNFGNYNKTYGAIAGVIIVMLWLLITALAILLGAEINAEMEKQTVHDTTAGQDRPLGERQAYAADHVAPDVGDR